MSLDNISINCIENVEKLKQHLQREIREYNKEELFSSWKELKTTVVNERQLENCPDLNAEAIKCSINLINNIFSEYEECFSQAIGQGLQFIHNLTVQNKGNQSLVWAECKNYFVNWLKVENEKNRNYIFATIHNITLDEPIILAEIVKDPLLTTYLFESALKGTDFAIILSESIHELISTDVTLFINNYLKSDTPCHNEMLNTLYKCVQQKDVDQRLVKWVKERYKNKAIKFLEEALNDTEMQEMYSLLKILVVLSGNDKSNLVLQEDVMLLERALLALEKIHLEGKLSGNDFTPTENIMTERTPVENLKSNTVRLIGNLCWKKRSLQDKVRELGLIPLILDCCIRDGKNPFITESVVFTIRNLCEGNLENQALIKNMNKITHDEMSQRTQNWPSVFIPPV